MLELSRALGSVRELAGTRVVAEAALIFSWEAWWATDLDSHPSEELRYLEQTHAMYRALWEAGITVDVVKPGADLSGYRLVVVPSLYLVRDAEAKAVTDFVADGGTAVITFFSGIVDEDDRVRLGGYPGAFTTLLGLHVDEFFPLAAGGSVALDDGATGTMWSENIVPGTAEVLVAFEDGPLPGSPAVTRNAFGRGSAWYVGTAVDRPHLSGLLVRAAQEAGVAIPADHADGVESVLRRGPDADYRFYINHTDAARTVGAAGLELLTGAAVDGMELPPGAVRVVKTRREN
ncbi:beta-galactosidase [Leifsonia sp. L25]|uniref:beta-galactosidase n=1 Tax=Leifsonia sp. L25 TaxID=3423957 RepID=UPI003D69EBA6